jgi:hypothetical protein
MSTTNTPATAPPVPTTITAPPKQVLNFSKSSYVQFANRIGDSNFNVYENSITLELWYLMTNNDGSDFQTIMKLGPLWVRFNYPVSTSPSVAVGTDNGWATYDAPVLYGWNHIALAFDFYSSGDTLKMYLNGVQVKYVGVTFGAAPSDVSVALLVGANGTGRIPFNGLSGFISDVRIWNGARTQSEISANMYLKLNGSETGLYAYWPMDEGSGTTVSDLAGTNNGTIVNADWVDTTKSPRTRQAQAKNLVGYRQEHQLGNLLCWAAAAASIHDYYITIDPTIVPIEQQAVAQDGIAACSWPPGEIAPPQGCNDWGILETGLKFTDNFAKIVDLRIVPSVIPVWLKIEDEIAAGRPVGAQLIVQGTADHAVVIVGYRLERILLPNMYHFGLLRNFMIADPASPDGTRPVSVDSGELKRNYTYILFTQTS